MGRKSYVSAARGAAKREEKQSGTEEETNYWSSPTRRRDEPMKKQNRENKEMDSNTHRQETEEAKSSEKLGEGVIRKRRIQEEIATKPKKIGGQNTKEKVEQRNMTGGKY